MCRTPAALDAWRRQLKYQRGYMHERYRECWTNAITNNLSNSKVLWSNVSGLLEPRPPSSTSKHTADDFANHFRNKVDTTRNITQNSPAAVIQSRLLMSSGQQYYPRSRRSQWARQTSNVRLIRSQPGSSSDCAQCCLARSRASATRRSLKVCCRRARSTPSSDCD